MGLANPDPNPNLCQREKSSLNTSLVSVAVTDHLRDRQVERAVGRRELQAAKKHGDKFRQPSGKISHQLGSVRYVTSKDFKVGVTGIRLDSGSTEVRKESATTLSFLCFAEMAKMNAIQVGWG